MTYKVLDLDTPNKNGRVYTTDLIRNMIESNDVKNRIENKTLFVENKMPMSFSSYDVNIENVCGLVEDLYITNSQLHCKVKILSIHPGAFDVLSSDNFAIRPRGIGEFEEDGKTIKNYELLSLAITENPA